MSKNLKATNAKNPIYASEVGAAAATKATAAMPSKGTKFLIKPDLGKNKKDLLKTMVYHDSTAMVFAKEVQSQMLTSMNPKSPSGRHDDSPQGPNQVVLSLEGAHHELDSATNKVYVQMQNQQQLLTNLKAAHQKSPPQYIAHAPAFVHQQQHQPHHVDIMPATSTVAVTPPPPPLAQQAQPPTAVHHPSPAASPSSTSATTTTATTTTTTKRGGKSAAAKVQFKCELCGMTFGSKSAHTSHTKSHANKGEITSSGKLAAAGEGAGKELTQIKAISTAANGGGGGDPYQCNVCQKTFAVPARLIRHYRTHTGERPFECEFCHKLFSVKENLQVHRRIHTKERPYKCDVCGRAFEHSGKLHRHMRIHTGERPHKCSVCEKTFIQSGQLVIHMRTHTGEKPYKCPVEGCGKGFTCSKQLKVHSRTHTGEKPYHCDICFRDFGYNHVLKLHRVQHYGSKCYKCTICDETFKGKKEMEAHIKGHANDDGAEGAGSDGSNGAPVASSSSRSSPAPMVASPDSGNHIKSESIGADLDVLDNAVASLLDSGKQDSLLPTSTQQFIGSSAQSPMSSAASPSSLSASYLSSVGSPALSGNSSTTTLGLDALDTNSYHGEAPKAMVFTAALRGKPQAAAGYVAEEMPTDLSVPQLQQEVKQLPTTTTTTSNAQPNPPTYYEAEAEAAHYRMQENSLTDLQSVRNYHHVASNGMAYNGDGLSSQQQQQQQQVQQPTINPALLEAASIASRSVLLESREHEATEAALQILQLNRSRTPGDMGHHSLIPSGLSAESSHYEDMYETNELISHYKRGDLAKHGLHKGYVPVPKFESSLHLDENIVRKVEAAIAPLRTSTESPERSSSPESDCMMMADRDIMTLPLRKRKIYMSEKDKMQATRHEEHGAPGNGEVADIAGICEMNTKAVRMSSVIQFAKAS